VLTTLGTGRRHQIQFPRSAILWSAIAPSRRDRPGAPPCLHATTLGFVHP
jgi:hypothetical protein